MALVLLVVFGVVGVTGASTATAQDSGTTGPGATSGPAEDAGVVSVVSVNGLIDPVVADLIDRSVDEAKRARAVALVFQVDLQGSVVGPARLGQLVAHMRSELPVFLWIGPTGSELTGDAAYLTFGASSSGQDPKSVGMAPGTSIGGVTADPAAVLGTVAGVETKVAALRNRLDAKQAEDAKVATFAPTLGDFLVGLPSVQTKEITVNGQTRREPVTRVVFSQLSILDSFMHTAASPAVAYLMLTVGLALLVFELFTAGVGVAGVIGAVSFVLSCYGLAVLPTRWWGIVLIVIAMVAFAVDVQTGVPRFWTGVGMVLYILGSLTVFDGVSMSWITISVGIAGVALAFLAGMPSMVRTRFSTPTIGREWMIGELGRAVSAIDPDGVVQIQGAQWRAYTNRATPIEELDQVRVVGIEGLVLEVEPEEGGARDYRERGGREPSRPEARHESKSA